MFQKPIVKYGLIALVAGLFVWQLASKTTAGGTATDFTLVDQAGERMNLSDLQGNVVILDFWATWCPPCKAEIPGFVELHEKYNDKGLKIVGVSLDETGWNEVRPFLKEYGVEYTIGLWNQEMYDAFGRIGSIPTTFVIDKEGVIRKKYVGYQSDEVFEQDYLQLINS